MKLKWSKAESKYFSKSVLTAEHDYSWVGWLLVAMCSLTGLLYFWLWKEIYHIYLITKWNW